MAEALVAQFQRMVQRDGGVITLLGVESGVVRIGYSAAQEAACEDGRCPMPRSDLQQLMSETLGRRSPALRIEVEEL